MKKRAHYALDENNRLISADADGKQAVLDGSFELDKNNRLNFARPGVTKRIRFDGAWKLDQKHNLVYTLNKTSTQHSGDSLVIKGSIIEAGGDSLVFELTGADRQGNKYFRILQFSGTWRADPRNHLVFEISRRKESLVFSGLWKLNENQQVEYLYQRISNKRKVKNIQELTFKGWWRIDSRNQVSYQLKGSTKSVFSLRVQLESPSLYPQEGVIKYRFGIGLEERANKPRTLEFFGDWKISRDLGLSFEMDYGREGRKRLEFGGKIRLSPRNELMFSLVNKRKEPLGFTVIYTHAMLRMRESWIFMRLSRLKGEGRLEAGVRVSF